MPRRGASVTQADDSEQYLQTHAQWRRTYTGADTSALVASGLWKSRTAAAIYEHLDAGEESRKADMLPTVERKAR